MSVYLSALLGARLVDVGGRTIGRLDDLVARVEGATLAPVVGLVTHGKGEDRFLPLASLTDLAPRGGQVSFVAGAPEPRPYTRRPAEVLLGRDVMDGEVISLRGPRVVRVNDVALDRAGDDWAVTGIDTGTGALVRRLLLPRAVRLRRGAAGRAAHMLPWAELELLASEVPGGGVVADHRRLARLHPADIARVADAVPIRQATEIVSSLDDRLAAHTMEEMIDAKQADVVEELEPERAADILDQMAPDAAADVMAELEPEIVDDVLQRMVPEEAADVHALLTYPKNTAGGLMTTDYVMAPRALRAGEAAAYLRPQLERHHVVAYIYVVEETRDRRLAGYLSLRDLLLADPSARLDAVMTADLRHVSPDTHAAKVARIMSEYDLLALPVTDPEGRLLGIISVDDALEIILPRALRRRIPRVFS